MSTYLTSCILGIICNQVFLSVFSPGTTTTMAWWFSGPDWNNLKMKWDPNPFSAFYSMPRTAQEAVRKGYVKKTNCDDSPDAKYRGARYIINQDDESIAVLFDENGYIAGVQTVIPDNLKNGYPQNGKNLPFVHIGSSFYLTVYFVDPGMICKKGRTDGEFERQGTGTRLLIQTGQNPDTDFLAAPMTEHEADESPILAEGKIFLTMGKHYWYYQSKDMDCKDNFPVFLLFNGGKLNGFGFSLRGRGYGPLWEKPPKIGYNHTMIDPPTCLFTDNGMMSTLHFFFGTHVYLNWWFNIFYW